MDPIRAYDRSVNRLSRRELLKIAGSVGMAAIARPIAAQQTLARPLFMTYPFYARRRLGRSAAGRRRAVDAAGAAIRSRAAGCR